MRIIIVILLLISALFADLKIGDTFPNLSLIDQFGKKVKIRSKGRTKVIVSFEKSVSSDMKKFLDTKDKNFLTKKNATYVTDISSVPSFLVGTIVLPNLKKYPYRVALIYDDKGKKLNRKAGKVSVFKLKNGRVVGIDFVKAKRLKL